MSGTQAAEGTMRRCSVVRVVSALGTIVAANLPRARERTTRLEVVNYGSQSLPYVGLASGMRQFLVEPCKVRVPTQCVMILAAEPSTVIGVLQGYTILGHDLSSRFSASIGERNNVMGFGANWLWSELRCHVLLKFSAVCHDIWHSVFEFSNGSGA